MWNTSIRVCKHGKQAPVQELRSSLTPPRLAPLFVTSSHFSNIPFWFISHTRRSVSYVCMNTRIRNHIVRGSYAIVSQNYEPLDQGLAKMSNHSEWELLMRKARVATKGYPMQTFWKKSEHSTAKLKTVLSVRRLHQKNNLNHKNTQWTPCRFRAAHDKGTMHLFRAWPAVTARCLLHLLAQHSKASFFVSPCHIVKLLHINRRICLSTCLWSRKTNVPQVHKTRQIVAPCAPKGQSCDNS